MLRRLWLAAVLAAALALLAAPGAGAAADARLGDEPDDTVVVLSGDVTVGPHQTVDGVYVASGDVVIEGHVTDNVVVLSGDVTVTGKIDGDLFTASGEGRVEGAEIGGDVLYTDERPEVSRDTVVEGEVKRLDWPELGGALPFVGTFLIWLAFTVSLAVLGVLLILIAPRAADSVAARSRERVGPTIAIGIAIGIGLPVAVGVAAITVVGLPLAFLGLLALFPLWAVAYCASAYALGRRLLGPSRDRMLSYLAGFGVLQVAGLVPFLDLLVGLAATVFGLGLIGAAIGAARKQPDSANPAPAPDAVRTPDS